MISERARDKRLAGVHGVDVERNARKGSIGRALFQDGGEQRPQGRVYVCKGRGIRPDGPSVCTCWIVKKKKRNQASIHG